MATYVLGYVARHFAGHGGFLPGREPHYHGLSSIEAVVSHLRSDRWTLAAILLETLLAGILSLLSVRDE